jgi:hypothetical protein
MTNTFLYNKADPTCLGLSTVFTVTDSPVMIVAAGLLPGQGLPIEVQLTASCDHTCPVPTTYWTPLYRGCQICISHENNQYIELIPGTYRIDTSSLPPTQPVVIATQDTPALRGAKPSFCYPVSSCGSGGGTGTSGHASCPPAIALGNVSTWG